MLRQSTHLCSQSPQNSSKSLDQLRKTTYILWGLLPFFTQEGSSLQAWCPGDIARQPAVPEGLLKAVLQTSLSFTGCRNDLSVEFCWDLYSTTPCCLRLPIKFSDLGSFYRLFWYSVLQTDSAVHRLPLRLGVPEMPESFLIENYTTPLFVWAFHKPSAYSFPPLYKALPLLSLPQYHVFFQCWPSILFSLCFSYQSFIHFTICS